MTVDYLYTDREIYCVECGEPTHYFDGNADVPVCDSCTDGPPLSDHGKKVTREVFWGQYD